MYEKCSKCLVDKNEENGIQVRQKVLHTEFKRSVIFAVTDIPTICFWTVITLKQIKEISCHICYGFLLTIAS